MDLTDFFSPEGPLARCVAGYEPRSGQMEMADAVSGALTAGRTLLAEAGTGTGKTLAYLAPAILAGKKVVVSTATKTLQAQIVKKDAPLLAQALGRPISVMLLKGRQNYLCLRRFENFRAQPLFRFTSEARLYQRLERWAGATETGDRAEMTDLPDDFAPWREVCSTSDTCWGGRCPREEDCHLLRWRRAAQRAQVVVVNHHLFFADLAVRASGAAEVIPRYEAVVFDEAHHLESVATQFFGTRISNHQLAELVRDAAGSTRADPAAGPPVAALGEASQTLWSDLSRGGDTTRRLRRPLEGDLSGRLADLLAAFDRWADWLRPRQAQSQEIEALYRRTTDTRADLALFAEVPAPGEVRWLQTRGRTTSLHAAPVEVGPVLSESLFANRNAIVLTSATLRVGSSFAFLKNRLGVPDETLEIAVESPFDYGTQGLLYVPDGLPDPRDPDFATRVVTEIAALLNASSGRAFCLFTSHRVLRIAAASLPARVPYRLLVQGDAPREALLESFREDTHSVLLGAQSFWEGVDVPGESLSAVIIDKLPFATPSEPLVEARIEATRARGESPFAAYQLPAAAMALRQGVGRLIRRADDRGVVAVLDRRLVQQDYGRLLRASLPPFPLTRCLSDVQDFFGHPGPA